jgi:hypothetical protein
MAHTVNLNVYELDEDPDVVEVWCERHSILDDLCGECTPFDGENGDYMFRYELTKEHIEALWLAAKQKGIHFNGFIKDTMIALVKLELVDVAKSMGGE